MKRKIIFILLVLATRVGVAQDIIIKKDGTKISAKVIEISATNIKYRKFSNSNGPVYNIAKSSVFMIKYENGEKDVFNEKSEKPSYSSLYIENKEESETSNNPKTNKIKNNKENNNIDKFYHGSISAGFGTCHGGIGAKLLVNLGTGTGDDGLFLSLGTFKSELFWAAGIQWSASQLYMTLLYGDIGVKTTTTTVYTNNGSYSSYTESKVSGLSMTIGYRINLDKTNRWFVDIGSGFSEDGERFYFALDAAVGIRF